MEKEVLKTGMNAAEAYEAPACDVMELRMEGVLCGSTTWGDLGDGQDTEEGDDAMRMLFENDDY